ncbi:MAG: hypothetical protein ACRDRT_01110 [Pseudonocardiaceae bacterium]
MHPSFGNQRAKDCRLADGGAGKLRSMSNAATHDHEGPHGTSLLPPDLTEEEVAAAPILASLDALVIEDLTDDEYELFVAALSS